MRGCITAIQKSDVSHGRRSTTSRPRQRCPACSDGLVADPIGTPLRCARCGWCLITLTTWRKLPPLRQGYVLYMQGNWPTSELSREKNPYTRGSAAHAAFEEGERRGVLEAQDGEE